MYPGYGAAFPYGPYGPGPAGPPAGAFPGYGVGAYGPPPPHARRPDAYGPGGDDPAFEDRYFKARKERVGAARTAAVAPPAAARVIAEPEPRRAASPAAGAEAVPEPAPMHAAAPAPVNAAAPAPVESVHFAESVRDEERKTRSYSLGKRQRSLLMDEETDLMTQALEFRNIVHTRTRTHMLKTYTDVFTGRDAIDAWVRAHSTSRQAAMDTCQQLMESDLFDRVDGKKDQMFGDDKTMYRFANDMIENEEDDVCPPDLGSSEEGGMSGLRLPAACFVANPAAGEANEPEYLVVNTDGYTPMVAFVNSRSGGQQGPALIEQFEKLLGKHQVFDLANGGPKKGLEMFKNVPGHTVLGCGGDGTIGWILSVIDTIDYTRERPPVGILPLGTGNDLARITGWGGGYTGERLTKIIHKQTQGNPLALDRWLVEFKSFDGSADKSIVLNNYASIGFDAEIALKFHEAREANPAAFKSRILNKAWYARFGAENMLQHSKSLRKVLEVTVDGKPLDLRSSTAIVLLNIPSYSAGADLWGSGDDSRYEDPSVRDRLIEIVGISNTLHMTRIQGHLDRAHRLGQGRDITIKFIRDKTMACQVDGEPWRQVPSEIRITHHNQRTLLFAGEGKVSLDAVDFALSNDEIEQLAVDFRHNGPETKTRTHMMNSYDDVFIGSEAIDWIQYHLRLEDRTHAWKAGQMLFERGIMEHLLKKHTILRDQNLFYVFKYPRNPHVVIDPPPSDPFLSALDVTVIEGRGIKGRNQKNTVTVQVGHQSFTSSPASKKSQGNPVWGTTFTFIVGRSNEMITIRVTNPFVGQVVLPLSAIKPGSVRDGFFSLQSARDKNAGKDLLGEVRVKLRLIPLRGQDRGSFRALAPLETEEVKKSMRAQLRQIGDPNHRCATNYDNLYRVWDPSNPAGREPKITALFEYGMVPRRKAEIDVYAQDAGSGQSQWESVGRFVTDDKGWIEAPLPDHMKRKAGYYRVRCVVVEDGTVASGQIFILAKGQGIVVFDMDGTITVGDQEVIKQFLAESASFGTSLNLGSKIDLQERSGAITMVLAWAARGYLPVYLSGRQGSFYNLTRDWLVKKGLPPGPMQLTDTHAPTLPVYFSVGNFKTNYMKYLRDELELDIAAVYGNTGTDIRAYEEMGIPKNVTYIAGMFGGNKGTVKVGSNFDNNIQTVLEFPESRVEVPWKALDW